MSAIKTLFTTAKTRQIFDIIKSYKNYFVDMTKRNREEQVRKIIPTIKTIPEFKLDTPTISATEIGNEISELFGRTAKNAYFKMMCNDCGRKTLAKAHKYKIPYNVTKIDWLHLIDRVNEYDFMIGEAAKYGMYWDISEYDPTGLKSKLEEHIRLKHSNNKSH